jgi:hypothetical protein
VGSATSITIAGYDANGLVGEVSSNISPTSYTFVPADFQNVTFLLFDASGGGSDSLFLMDGLTYTISDSSPIPEPNGLAIVATALLGFGVVRRHCRNL